MRLDGLGPAAFVAGLGAIAVALYLLQRLRVRHRELQVVTTLFWHEAVEDTRARVLTHRFRHPLAFLLALLIAAGIWLALATPRADTRGDRDYVVLIDASAATSSSMRLARLTDGLPELVERLPRDARTVLAIGGATQTLLRPGEEGLALAPRLSALVPSAAPPGFERELARLARRTQGARPVTAILVGDAPVSAELIGGLPEGWEVRRAPSSEQLGSSNAGILGIGASPAASGRWDTVDVLVEMQGEGTHYGVVLLLDGQMLDAPPTLIGDPAHDPVLVVFRDIPARGGLVTAQTSFTPGGPPTGNRPLLVESGDQPLLTSSDLKVQLVLPDRPVLAVAVATEVDAPLRALMAADPGVTLVDEADADVVIRRTGDAFGGPRPALELVPESSQEETILLRHPEGDDSARVLVETLATLGLEPNDAERIASRTGRALTLGAAPAATRGVGVWDELFAPEAGFVGSRAFPACVAGLVRYLAGVEPMVPYVAAGEAVAATGDTAWIDSSGRRLDSLGAAFVPPATGMYENESGARLFASLASLPGSGAGSASPDELPQPSTGPDLVAWVLLLVMALALGEWVLYQRGQMP